MSSYIKNITILSLILLVGCSRLPWKEESSPEKSMSNNMIDSDEILIEEETIANVDQLYGLHNKQTAEINSHKKDIDYLESKIDSLGLQVSNDMQSIRSMIMDLTSTVIESDNQRKIDKAADTTKSIDAVTQLNMKVRLNKDRVEQYTMFFDSVRFDMNQRYVILDNEVSTLKKALIEYISSSDTSAPEAIPEVSDQEFRDRYSKYYKHYINEDYDLAIAGFNELLAINRNHDLSENCQYWMGEAYFAKGDYAVALKTFYDVFAFPNEKKEDDSQLKIGICYIKLNDNVRAKKELQNYVDQYPQGEFVSKAKSYLGQLD